MLNSALFRSRSGGSDLLLPAAVLSGLGLITVTTASLGPSMDIYSNPLRISLKHLFNCAIGVAAMIWVMSLSEEKIRSGALALLGISIVLLLLVLVPGVGDSGRWLKVLGVGIQPSEIARASLLVFLADLIARRREELIESWEALVVPLGLAFGVSLLIFLEPDFSSALITASVAFAMLFLGGMRWRDTLLVASGLTLVGLALFGLADYRVERLICLDFQKLVSNAQGVCYQTVQSLSAISQGGLFGGGVGVFNERTAHLPEAHTDFAFSVMVSEMGSLIAALVVLLFAMLVALLLARGYRAAKNSAWFESMLCYGYALSLGFQVMVNLGVNLALLPATGLPLPFVSYGGSNFLTHCLLLGVICRGEGRLKTEWR